MQNVCTCIFITDLLGLCGIYKYIKETATTKRVQHKVTTLKLSNKT